MKKFMMSIWNKLLKPFLSSLDFIIAIGVAIYATYLGAIGGEVKYAVAAIALAISVISFTQLIERKGRKKLNKTISKLDSTASKLLGNISADEFFKSGTSEKPFIVNSKKSMLLIQETGQLIAETMRDELVYFLKQGGKLDVILVLNTNSVTQHMSYRNKQLYTIDVMKHRMQTGINTFEVLKKEAGQYARNIEIRFIRYPIDFTAVFTDPYGSTKEQKSIIRLQGFKVAFNDKLDFVLDASTSKNIFNAYLTQALTMWNLSNRCSLLTGAPRSGKTTVLKKLYNKISNDDEFVIKGFLTEEILDSSGSRTGFNLSIVNDNKSYPFATKIKDKLYKLETNIMEEILLPEINAGIKQKEGIFLLDEIGIIQIENPQFKLSIMKLLENKNISIIGTISNENENYFNEIKNHIRVQTLLVDKGNRETLAETIYKEIKQ